MHTFKDLRRDHTIDCAFSLLGKDNIFVFIDYKKCEDKKKKDLLKLSAVEAGLPLVKNAVMKLHVKDFSMREDLLQIGALGLINAIENYDENKDAVFTTYAYHHINGNIRHYLRDKANIVHLPRSVQDLVNKVSKTYEQLRNSGEKNITPEMLADKLNLPVEKIIEVTTLPATKNILSLEQLSGFEDDNLALIEKISEANYKEISAMKEDFTIIREVINELPDEMKTVIKLSFFDEYNQRQIAAKLGISQMQVSRLIKKALVLMYKGITKGI